MDAILGLPRFLSDKTLERLLVQHGPLVERLTGLAMESAHSLARHQILLTGPSGSGKTHLATCLAGRLKAFEDRLLVAHLPEKPAGITTLADLFLETLLALAKAYPRLELHPPLAGGDEDALERAAETLLRKTAARTPVLIVLENLQQVFSALGPTGQKALRAFLQQDPCASLLATTPAPFPEIAERKAPFFGFFRIEPIAPLAPEAFVELATRAARPSRPPRLDRPALAALHHLGLGNARLAVLAGRHAACARSWNAACLAALADQTGHQEARLADLSPQQAKIIDLLAAHPSPLAVKAIARRALATEQTVSSQLRDLKARHLVASTRSGRNSFYELSDTLLRVSIELLRRGPERPSRLLTFLHAWFAVDKRSLAAVASLAAAPPETWPRAALSAARARRPTLAAALVRGLDLLRGPLVTAEARRLWLDSWRRALPGEHLALDLLEAGLADPEHAGVLTVPVELQELLRPQGRSEARERQPRH